MFDINDTYRSESFSPIINGNFNILHFDELPIVYTGTNLFGSRVLCSFCQENEDSDLFRYFAVVITSYQYDAFVNSEISLLSIFKENKELYVLDYDINNNLIDQFCVPLSFVKDMYLPTKDSFLKESNYLSNSLEFGFSLKGKLADVHKGIPAEINEINSKINIFLLDSIKTINNLGYNFNIYSQPSKAASYRLNFNIEFKDNSDKQITIFNFDNNRLSLFYNRFLNYLISKLPNEKNEFSLDLNANSKDYNELEEELNSIYQDLLVGKEIKAKDNLPIYLNSSAESLVKISKIIAESSSCNKIEVGTYTNESFIPFSYFDKTYFDKVEMKLFDDSNNTIENDGIRDEFPHPYRILVYSLNLDSGNGKARLYFDESEEYNKISIKVNSKENGSLNNTDFTKSMHEDKVINVMGISTKKDGIVKKIEFEV